MKTLSLLLATWAFASAATASALCERLPMDPESPPGITGSYELIGKAAGTGAGYTGTLRIGYGKQGYTMTRTVGGSDVHGMAWMERCGMDEIHFFRARYDTRPVTEVSCSLGMDGDNYYRATCKTWQADRRGLEAWFQHP